jgi:hypothetical protein
VFVLAGALITSVETGLCVCETSFWDEFVLAVALPLLVASVDTGFCEKLLGGDGVISVTGAALVFTSDVTVTEMLVESVKIVTTVSVVGATFDASDDVTAVCEFVGLLEEKTSIELETTTLLGEVTTVGAALELGGAAKFVVVTNTAEVDPEREGAGAEDCVPSVVVNICGENVPDVANT